MLLYEVEVGGEIAVDDFGSIAVLSILGHEAIGYTESLVTLIISKDFSCHLEGVPNLQAIGEEVAILRGGQEPLGQSSGEVVEASIVGTDDLDVVLTNHISEDVANGLVSTQDTLTALDVCPILGDFVSEESGSHQLFIKEHISYHIAVGFVDIAIAIDHSKANVIAQRVIKSISGFGIEDEELSFKDVHGVHFLSCFSIVIITL
jgi:hypothetical protein